MSSITTATVPPVTVPPAAVRVPRPDPQDEPTAPRGVSGSHDVIVGSALSILAALLLCLVLDVTLIGHLRQSRDQSIDYAQLRLDLANGTLPVGQVNIDGSAVEVGRPIALLEIPRLGLRQVVVEGTTSRALMRGPGHRRDSPLPGQPGLSVLMGRRAGFGSSFNRVDSLRANDTLIVTTSQAKQSFRVLDVRRAGDPVPPALARGSSRLVLETADGSPYLPRGLVRIDADLTSAVQPAPARFFGYAALPPAERELGTDTAALVPLVLKAEALVLAAVLFAVARLRWGRRQSWLAGVPVLLALGLTVADEVARLLPNLL